MASIDEIHSFLDLKDDKKVISVKQPEKHRRSRVWAYISACCVSLVLGMSFFLPLFADKSGFDILSESLSSGQSDAEPLVVMGDEYVEPEPYLYEHFVPPSNSFGMGETMFKSVNWSFFKSLFNAHTDWSLEYNIGNGWQDGNQYLDVSKTWVDDLGGWKINLTFTNPSSMNVKARFTFACDLAVLDYVERDGTMVHLNYTIPGTSEVYSVFFNWSDLKQYPNLWFNKGVSDGLFWFRFGHDNIPPGVYVFDPTFGETGTGETYERVYDHDDYYGTRGVLPVDGVLNSMSVYVRVASGDTSPIECRLLMFDSSYDFVWASEIREISNYSFSWETFRNDSSSPSLSSGIYYMFINPDGLQSTKELQVARAYSYGDGAIYDYDNHIYFPNNPASFTNDTYAANRCLSIYATYTEGGGEPSWSNVCPVASGEHPSNGSTGVSLQPAVGATITDGNSNHTMNVTFATNVSGDWVNKQTNSSVGNNTGVNWTYSQANVGSTKYWWRVYVHDGICNQSFTFSFTTAANETPASWQVVENIFNGNFSNTTVWKVVDSDFNGVFINTTVWKTLENTFNGSFVNDTLMWQDVDTDFDGSFSNTTVWKPVDSDFNGVFTNTTTWKNLDTGFDGVFTNTTVWKIVENIFNGSFVNDTLTWNLVENTFNGEFTNTTTWQSVDTGFNGSFINTTTWKNLDTDFDGEFINTTTWQSVDSDFNGEFTNDSLIWNTVDTDWNGTFTNETVTWAILSSDWNGRFINWTAGNGSVLVMSSDDDMAMNTVFLFVGMVIGMLLPISIVKRKRRKDDE